MSYANVLSDKAYALGTTTADAGKLAKVFQPTILAELLAEARRHDGNGGMAFGNPIARALSDNAISELKDSLQRVTNLTFNSALPICRRVLERLQQVINPDVPVAYQEYEVHSVIFGSIWDTPLVQEMAHNGTVRPVDIRDSGSLIKSLDDANYEDLLALASTGLHDFDLELDQTFGRTDESKLRTLFIDAFNRGVFPNESVSSLIVDNSYGDWLLISRWANRLVEVVPTESRFPADQYQLVLASIENRANRVIAAIQDYRKQSASTGRMIVRQYGKGLWVLHEPYSAFLSNGGSPEALLAVALTNGRHVTADEVKADQIVLESKWERHVQIATETHSQQTLGRARHELHIILGNEVSEFYKESGDKASEGLAQDKIRDLVSALPNDFTTDAHRWVFDIVAELLFKGTDVGMLLTCLRETGDKYGAELNSDVIRAMATTNYVGDWLADIVQLVEHGYGVSSYSRLAPVQSEMATEGINPTLGEWLEPEMIGEAIDWKTAAMIGGGIAILAVVGFGVYTLMNKLKNKGEKIEKGEQAIVERQEKIAEVEEKIEELAAEITSEAAVIESVGGMAEIEVPPSLEEVSEESYQEPVEITPTATGNANDEAMKAEAERLLAEETSRAEAAALAAVEASKKSVNKGKIWEGTGQNVMDFLGNKHGLSVGVTELLLAPETRRTNNTGFSRIAQDISYYAERFVGSSDYWKSVKEDIDKIKEEHARKPDVAMAKIESFVKEFVNEIADELSDSINGIDDLAAKIFGKYAHSMASVTKGDIVKMVSNNREGLGGINEMIDQVVKSIDVNIKGLGSTIDEKNSPATKEQIEKLLARGSTIDVGVELNNKVEEIKLNKVSDTIKKVQENLTKGIDKASSVTNEEMKATMADIRWAFGMVDKDPALVNKLVDGVKSVNDANTKVIDLAISMALADLKATYDAQGQYTKALNAVMKHNTARKKGYQVLAKKK